MRRRSVSLALAALFAFSAVVPMRAAEPAPSVEPPATELPGPSAEPAPTLLEESSPTPEPSDPAPTSDPVPPADPAPVGPAPSEPDAGPTASPGKPSPQPSGAPDAGASTEPVPAASEAPMPDEAGEYIVVLRPGTDPDAEARRHERAEGIDAERTFDNAIDGYAAALDDAQLEALEDDPDVVAVIPDETFTIQAQTTPTGVARVGARTSAVAQINGADERVDADVAIVDTGIQPNHPDLNVVGGYDCSSTNPARWRDLHGHGTHVAGTVGALDNTTGVVGVAPGARLWAVKILDDSGSGKLSWYICGLDWIAAQRDPLDPSRPLFEAVNMSVGKQRTITDDNNCGRSIIDGLHQAVCRVVEAGIPVAVAAANASQNASKWVPATYKEVITVSALADTDGKAGGLGGNRCYSWGSYDVDDTFANFSNYGADIDIMAPGKCIWSTMPGSSYAYMSGTSMATPAVAGAIALYKASRPNATPAEVKEALQYLGNLGWKTSTDPDSSHEKLLDVSRLSTLGTFSLNEPATGQLGELGGTVSIPVTLSRSSTFFERVRLSLSKIPSGWSARLSTTSLLGWSANSVTVYVTAPSSVERGTYDLTLTGTNQGRSRSVPITVLVDGERPVAAAPSVRLVSGGALGSSAPIVLSWPAATDASTAVVGYEWAFRKEGYGWSTSRSTTGRSASLSLTTRVEYEFRVRARDEAGKWSAWAVTDKPYEVATFNDRSKSLVYRGTWYGSGSKQATARTLMNSKATGATVRIRATGRGYAIVAPTASVRGWYEVRVDGALVATVSLGQAAKHRRIVWVQAYATSATRTIELRAVRSSDRPYVTLDALLVLR